MPDPRLNRERLKRTLVLLQAETSQLAELAELSGYDPFTFYRRSNLADLDLSDQDLTGLNFEEADLTGANLRNVQFDVGAFNGSKLSPEFENLKDEFDTYLEDTISDQLCSTVYAFASFREETLEKSIERAKFTYAQLAEASGLSTATIRKARKSGVLALDSTAAISKALTSRFYSEKRDATGRAHGRTQPMVKFLELLPNGGFKHVPRSKMLQVIEMAEYIERIRYPEGRPSYYWRQNPGSIEWYYYAYLADRHLYWHLVDDPIPQLSLPLRDN